MMRSLTARIPGAALILLLSVAGATGQDSGSAAAPIFKDTDPYEQPERKEPSMWHRPSADTPAAQLALATQYEQAKRLRRAISANRSLVHKWHNAPEAVTAQQNLARLLEAEGDHEEAFLEYQYLITYFAGQFAFLDTLDRQYRCANVLCHADSSFLGLSSGSINDVRRMYERILLNGPNWAKAPDVAMRIGELREVTEDLPEAIAAYEQVQNRFPGTEAAHNAAYRGSVCRSQFALLHPRDAKARNDAVAAMAAFLLKYPNDRLSESLRTYLKVLEGQTLEAAYAQAVFYDRQRHDRAAAMAAYRDFQRRFPDAPQAKAAATRLQVLERNAPEAPRQGETNAVVR